MTPDYLRAQKQELVNQVRANICGILPFFPTNPHHYVERVRSLLLTALFPQSGPLVAQRASEGSDLLVDTPINIGRVEAW